MATKIDIVSGFLGAGKTTLIKKLIAEAFKGEQLVLIENEFGEIGIDGGFMKDAGIEITEMNQGCICCSLVGDFGTALGDVLTKYTPDRIIIEPSGVGKLSDVVRAVAGILDENAGVEKDEDLVLTGHKNGVEVELGAAVTVADAKKAKMYIKNFGEFYNNQIESAKTIILSRTGDISEDKLNECLSLIRETNDRASIITTPWEELDGKQIVSAFDDADSLRMELLEEEDVCPECGHHHEDGECCHHHDHDHEDGECCHHHDHDHEDGECCHHHDHDHEEHEHHHDHDHEDGECCHHHDHDHHGHHHHHHADEVFTSVGIESPKKYEESELKAILEKLSAIGSDSASDGDAAGEYGRILRAKGIVPAVEGEWFHFDLVPGEYEVRRGSADYTGRLCVIGAELKEDAIKELFA
ncbi:MAG: GTP-binding protein [Eubacterium sp.]|nr:GTP-binding protein [Eubacterium sp.]